MSHRMGVLSRRLQRFAVGFSFATVAFLIGLFAAANTEGRVVFFAGLVGVCLFATFFLWLAHGFAWAMIPEEPVEAMKTAEVTKPLEAIKPAETMKPAEAMKPAAAMKPADLMKPAEAMKPSEAIKPAETMKPAEAMKPAAAMKPADLMKPAEAMKPAEEKKRAKEKVIASEDPPGAKYTITGRRIS